MTTELKEALLRTEDLIRDATLTDAEAVVLHRALGLIYKRLSVAVSLDALAHTPDQDEVLPVLESLCAKGLIEWIPPLGGKRSAGIMALPLAPFGA